MGREAQLQSFCEFSQYFKEFNNTKISNSLKIQQKRVYTAKTIQVTRKVETQTDRERRHIGNKLG